MDSNTFLNDLMAKMKLPEAKGKKKAEQSESVAQILAAMQKGQGREKEAARNQLCAGKGNTGE